MMPQYFLIYGVPAPRPRRQRATPCRSAARPSFCGKLPEESLNQTYLLPRLPGRWGLFKGAHPPKPIGLEGWAARAFSAQFYWVDFEGRGLAGCQPYPPRRGAGPLALGNQSPVPGGCK